MSFWSGLTAKLARFASCALLGAPTIACSEAKPAATEPGGGASVELDPSTPIIGSFAITLVAPTSSTDGFTSVLGRVYEAPMPDQLAWESAGSAQGCELRIPVVPFCEPACDSSAVCTQAEGCVPYPKAQDLGTVTLAGLQEAAIEMQPVAATYQLPPQIELPHPPVAEGTRLRLQTGGGNYAPFAITAAAIAPLELAGPEIIPVTGSEPLLLTWQAPSNPKASRVQVKVDLSHHGGLKGVIECTVADDGEAEIEATLLERLVALGTAGFPTINVTRVASGGTKIDAGGVLLSVLSRVERSLEIAGVVSCNDHDECSAGQVCAPDRTCQDS